jgi:Fic family protein
MNERLLKINSLKHEIDQISPKGNWDDAYYEKIKIEFTFQSNKIENNPISYGQTVQFLKNAITPKNIALKDCVDIKNHYEILDQIFKSFNVKLYENQFIELHKVLMKDEFQWNDLESYSPGKYKWDTNFTFREGNVIHYYLDYKLVPEAIHDLVLIVNEKLGEVDFNVLEKHPISIATYFHNRFLGEIHPFADGNGRICRIVTNNILLKSGLPPLFIRDIDKAKYFKLFENSSSVNLGPMLDFFADEMINNLISKKEFLIIKS